MDRPTLQEQFDACRDAAQAAGDPLLRELAEALKNDPEVARQLERQLIADARTKRELEKVAVPSGLQEMAALAFRQGASLHEKDRTRLAAVAGRVLETGPEKSLEVAEQAKPTLSPRRRLPKKSIAAVIVACTALLLVFAWQFGSSTKEVELNGKQFAEAALKDCLDSSVAWSDINAKPSPILPWNGNALPLTKELQPKKWRSVKGKPADKWIAWELSAVPGERVFVVTVLAPWKVALPQVLSQNPIHNTANWNVGVFRKGEISYAVIVEGNVGQFRSLIKNPSYARKGIKLPRRPVQAAT